MAHVLAFDVNETLLDLGALDPAFVHIFGDVAARREWFSQLLLSALVATVTGVYTDFGSTGIAALEMLAARGGVTLTAADRQRLREGMQRLPPHPEVRASLERLREAGWRMVTLTNSTEAVATAQLTNAGLRDLFEDVFSADTVRRLKPAPEPYQMVAARLGLPAREVWWQPMPGILPARCVPDVPPRLWLGRGWCSIPWWSDQMSWGPTCAR
jgi:2-haloacid dehalogenase